MVKEADRLVGKFLDPSNDHLQKDWMVLHRNHYQVHGAVDESQRRKYCQVFAKAERHSALVYEANP
jgi:hypothetical protein